MPDTTNKPRDSIMERLVQWIASGGVSENFGPRVKARKLAMDQFYAFQARDSDGVAILSGSTAEILDSYDTFLKQSDGPVFSGVANYVLTIVAVTPEGRHFLFKSNERGDPFLKYLTPDRARLILKGNFKSHASNAI